jgi:hypothetical protein
LFRWTSNGTIILHLFKGLALPAIEKQAAQAQNRAQTTPE